MLNFYVYNFILCKLKFINYIFLKFKYKLKMIDEEIVIQTDGNGRKIQKYLKKQLLGHGGFAKCYLMINLRTGQKFAGKVIRKKQLKQKGSKQKVIQQIQIHKSLNHQNICKFHDMFQFQNEIYIILQLCQNNSLKEFLKNRVRITELEAKYYLLQILNGLQYLHANNYLHRDIKLGNIFLNYKMQVKIGDFGLSTKLRSLRERRFTTCGTPNYIAPQILSQTGHSFQVDIWAVGIILYALLVGKPPFEAQTVDMTYQKIKENSFQFPKQIPLTSQCKHLIRQILQPNPKLRLNIEQIRFHQFILKNTLSIPLSLPPYTISIPPQSSYLKQFISQKHMKLSIYPRKISNVSGQSENTTTQYKLSRVLSLDKQMIRQITKKEDEQKSTLNRGHIYQNGIHQYPDRNRKQYSSSKNLIFRSLENANKHNKHETDAVIVICYLNLQHKYGMGYLLSNGNYGIVFNDKTSLTKMEVNNNFFYFDKQPYKYENLPQILKKKSDILEICLRKLEKQKKQNVLIPFQSDTFVKKIVVHQNFFLIKLSNGILQFFWQADTIILKGSKWIKWTIGKSEGQSKLNNNLLPQEVLQKVEQIKKYFSQSHKNKQAQIKKTNFFQF